MTLKFDGWPWKTIGHLFYTASSFVHHFKSIDEFKLELQSENAQFLSKLAIFCPVWPWNLIDDLGKLWGTSSILHQTLCIFQSHGWIWTGVTVWKRSIPVKIGNFFVPCDLEIWWMTLENNRAPPLYLHQALCNISKPWVKSNWS